MNCMFLRRGYNNSGGLVENSTVTITGTDHETYGYAAAQQEFMQEYERNKEKYTTNIEYDCYCEIKEEEEEVNVNSLPI